MIQIIEQPQDQDIAGNVVKLSIFEAAVVQIKAQAIINKREGEEQVSGRIWERPAPSWPGV